MNGMIQLDCEYTKENLLEMEKTLHKGTNKVCWLLSLVGAALLAGGIILAQGSLIYFGLFWLIFWLVRVNHTARKSVRQTLKHNKKCYDTTVKTTLKFYNTMLTAENHQTGSQLRTNYDEVVKLMRTKNLFVLLLPDNVAVMGDARSLTPVEADELWNHLAEKCSEAALLKA